MKHSSPLRYLALGTLVLFSVLGVTVAAQHARPEPRPAEDPCIIAHVHALMGMPPVCPFHQDE